MPLIQASYEQVKAVYQKKGYRFFDDPYDMNFIGVRSNIIEADKIDDTFMLVYRDINGNGRVFCAPMTTDPGLYYIEHPMNAGGCAMLCEGQYLGSHKLGMHKGYLAMVQVKPMTYWRGVTVETVGSMKLIKTDKAIVQSGITGANIHRMLPDGLAATVGKWSAMCQVIQSPDDHAYMVSLVRRQEQIIKTTAGSWTLFNELDFR